MLGISLRDAVDKVAIKCFKTAFGRMLGTTTYQKERSLWQAVSWEAAVTETALVSPDADGSVEICDIFITAEKKAGGSITIHFDDGTNEKDVVKSTVADGVLNVATNFLGKVQGWQSAILYYTIVGTFTGSILITFVKHNKAQSKTYIDMEEESGW